MLFFFGLPRSSFYVSSFRCFCQRLALVRVTTDNETEIRDTLLKLIRGYYEQFYYID